MARTTSASRSRSLAYDDGGLRQFFVNVLLVMTIGLIFTGTTALWISHDEELMKSLFYLHPVVKNGKVIQAMGMSFWWSVAAAVQLGIVIIMCWMGYASKRVSGGTSFAIFAVFAILSGVTLAPALYAYTDVSVAKVFFITATMFLLFAIWGKTTTVNLRGLSSFFLMGLIGLLVALVVNVFFASPLMDFVVSGCAVVLFAGLTAYDMQRLEDLYDETGGSGGAVMLGALTLYLDFLNLFLHLLRLLGTKKE